MTVTKVIVSILSKQQNIVQIYPYIIYFYLAQMFKKESLGFKLILGLWIWTGIFPTRFNG